MSIIKYILLSCLFILKLTPSASQSNNKIAYSFDRIAHYQTIGEVELQVCEMMNTESLLSEMDLNQAEKGQYYMNICLIEVSISGLKDKTEVLGRAYEYKGIRHYVRGEFDLAVTSFGASLEILTDYGYQYRIHRWLGVIHCLSENISKGVNHYEDAIKHAVKYYDEQDPQGDSFIFSLHSNITSAYAKIENFRKAKYHAHQALEYAKKITDKSLIATAVINEANILINEKKPSEAIEVIGNLDTIISDDMQIAANYYNILGTAYQQTAKYDLSIENFKKSNVLISEKSVLQESIVLNLLAISEAQYLKKDFHQALKTTQDVIQKLERKIDQYSSSLADAYHLKSKCLIALDEFDAAEQQIQKAIDIKGPFETWKLSQLSTMISIKAAQYHDTNIGSHLEQLIGYQTIIDSLILDLQVKHRHYEDEVNLNEYIYTAYSNNLNVINKLRTEHPSKFSSQMIFKYMETLKSIGLRKERKANIRGLNIPDNLLNDVSQLKYNLIKLQKERYESQQANQDITQIDSLYASTKYQYYAVLDILESQYPQYYKGKYKNTYPDLERVQAQLKQDEAIIEYFLSDSSIYVIGITTDTLFLTSTSKPEDWDFLITEFRKSLSDTDYIFLPEKYEEVFDLFVRHAHQLHNILFKDIKLALPGNISSLKIIPDNELYYIPFELLIATKSKATTYQGLQYLGQLIDISYAESTEYLFQTQNGVYDEPYTVIAPNYSSDHNKINPLPHSYLSAHNIKKQLDGTLINTDFESKDYFFTNSSSNILHFAGHAGISEDPALSRLILSEEAIYNSEIYQAELENQLTILSACNTGNGDFINGRGLQSLSRAFRFAGARSTLQSLWSVPDLQTSQVNEMVITNLNTGMTIQQALQDAKFNLLNESPKLYSHPFYWAGFVAFGDTDQVIEIGDHTTFKSHFLVLVGLLFIMIMSYIYFHKQE